MVQTRKQKRAQVAYDCVSQLLKKSNNDYVQLAKKFPALVHTCGLAQAVAFVQAKEKENGKSYLNHLTKVMGQDIDLGEKSRNAKLLEYQHFSREAIESATWIKRYAEALLEKEEKD
jgi:CRISPR-associated protein Cmr5